MRKFKVVLSVLLAVIMALSCTGIALADSEPKTEYLNEYSYFDESCQNFSELASGTTCANVYEFQGGEMISAVRLWIYRGKDVSAEISVYKFNPDKGINAIAKDEWVLADTSSEKLSAGEPVDVEFAFKPDVEKGEKYVVAVTYTAPNNDLVVATEKGETEETNTLIANPGESYYLNRNDPTGGGWIDASDDYGNFYINILTESPSEQKPEIKFINIDVKDVKIGYKESLEFIVATMNKPESAKIQWLLNGETDKQEGKTFKVENPEENYTVKAVITDNGKVLAETVVEINVTVKNSIIDKIVYFFTKTLIDFIKTNAPIVYNTVVLIIEAVKLLFK